jgi:UMF1 family MFS transporter
VTILEKIGLNRPELRAWAMYDWANSAFVTVVITTVFPVYYKGVAAQGLPDAVASSRFSFVTAASLGLVAVLAPVLGALADAAPIKKHLLGAFMVVGVIATAAMALIGPGDWPLALALFALANIGVAGSFVFYDALLPHLAAPDEIDRVSTAGYALGYLGGGVLLAFDLALIVKPEWVGLADASAGSRAAFVTVSGWWLGFSIPLFRRVPEPAVTPATRRGGSSVVGAFRALAATLRELGRYRQATVMLVGFLIYNDGIQTIIRMAAMFGEEVGIGTGSLIGAILLTQLIGIPFAFLFGQLAGWLGTKQSIFLGLVVYAGVTVLAYRLDSAAEFWALAVLVGMVQGGTQALSRSLFASMIPAAKSSEFFALFAVFEKFAGIFGPLLFGFAVLLTGSSRGAILSVVAFFVLGGLILSRVDVVEGRRAARAGDAW